MSAHQPRPTPARRGRLRRSDCSARASTAGGTDAASATTDPAGRRLRDPETLLRIKELAIPPAWEEVWICPDPLRPSPGHRRRRRRAQAVPVSPALARARRTARSSTHMVEFARPCRACAGGCSRALRTGEEPTRSGSWPARSACSTSGLFRVGSRGVRRRRGRRRPGHRAQGERHVRDGELVFDYPAKGGVRRVQAVAGPARHRRRQPRSSGGAAAAISCWPTRSAAAGTTCAPSRSTSTSRSLIGEEYSAKDFRTWNATVLAAVSLAADGREASPRRRASARSTARSRGGRGAGQHAGGGPALLHRPARVRPLSVGLDDRRGAGSDRLAARPRRPPARAAGARRAGSAGRRPRLGGRRALRAARAKAA